MKSSKAIRIAACVSALAVLTAFCGYSIYMYLTINAITAASSFIDLTLSSIDQAHSLLMRQSEYHSMMIVCIVLLAFAVVLMIVLLNKRKIKVFFSRLSSPKINNNQPIVVCPKCNNYIRPGDKFCLHCGAPSEITINK
jgi:hypothetical protein